VIPFDLESTEGKPGGSSLLDAILSRLQDTLASIARAVTNDKLVTVTLSTNPQRVIHGVKGPPVSWEIVGRNAGETVFESATLNTERGKFLYLQATGAVTVTVRFM
jgi:hypothetical protein